MRAGEPLDEHLAQANREFWSSAEEEFRIKLKAAENALRFVEADIPPTAASALAAALNEQAQVLAADIRRLVEGQTAFASDGSRDRLLRAPRERIEAIARELEAKAGAGAGTAALGATRRLLERLARLKGAAERNGRAATALSAKGCRLSAYDILVMLFECVRDAMLREEWTVPPPSVEAAPERAPDEPSLATTV
jgi:hypothetical protein